MPGGQCQIVQPLRIVEVRQALLAAMHSNCYTECVGCIFMR
jgi:hypothetical protein